MKLPGMGAAEPFMNGTVNGLTTVSGRAGPTSSVDDGRSLLPPNQRLRLRLAREREKISIQRDRVLRTRVLTHEKRNRLRHHRGDISILEADFHRALDGFIIQLGKEGARPLLSLYEQLRALRNIFGPLEDDYNQAENQLDQEEFSLERTEERFYKRYARLGLDTRLIEQPEPLEPTTELFQSDSEVESDGAALSARSHSLLGEYYSRIGDANLLREKLGDLLLERSEVMQEERSRARHHLPPLPEHLEFWEVFDRDWGQMMDELNVVEAEVQELKQRVREQGLLTDFSSDGSNEYSLAKVEEEHESPSNASTGPRDPIAAKDPLRSQPLSTRERVHYWLLSVMQSSPLEMRLFRIRASLEDEFPDEEKFMSLILYITPPGEDDTTIQDLSFRSVSGSGRAPMSMNFVYGRRNRHWTDSLPELSMPQEDLFTESEAPLAQNQTYMWSSASSV